MWLSGITATKASCSDTNTRVDVALMSDKKKRPRDSGRTLKALLLAGNALISTQTPQIKQCLTVCAERMHFCSWSGSWTRKAQYKYTVAVNKVKLM